MITLLLVSESFFPEWTEQMLDEVVYWFDEPEQLSEHQIEMLQSHCEHFGHGSKLVTYEPPFKDPYVMKIQCVTDK